MNHTFNTKKSNLQKTEIIDWSLIQIEFKNKLGLEIYESWLKKINFIDEFNNYILLSVPTRFIRDWITSRYLDQILQIVKFYKKDLIRIEFKITEDRMIKDESYVDPKSFKSNGFGRYSKAPFSADEIAV